MRIIDEGNEILAIFRDKIYPAITEGDIKRIQNAPGEIERVDGYAYLAWVNRMRRVRGELGIPLREAGEDRILALLSKEYAENDGKLYPDPDRHYIAGYMDGYTRARDKEAEVDA